MKKCEAKAGQTVSAVGGKSLPFPIGLITHVGRSAIGVKDSNGVQWIVNPDWLEVVEENK